MDKQKIGAFISSCRKKNGLTQALYMNLYAKHLIFKYQNYYMQKK